MRRPIHEQTAQPWRVHALATDFELLDVWRFPLRLAAETPLRRFLEFRSQLQVELVRGPGLAGQLFRFRGWLGRVFGWDEDPRSPKTTSGLSGDGSARSGGSGFELVYQTEEEALYEIENATVHALMHFGRVRPDADGTWAPQMSVYVKPRGLFGRFYMTLIGPFRHLIVYPSMMRAAERAWPRYAATLVR